MACRPIGLPHELLFWGEDVVGHVKEYRTILMLFQRAEQHIISLHYQISSYFMFFHL